MVLVLSSLFPIIFLMLILYYSSLLLWVKQKPHPPPKKSGRWMRRHIPPSFFYHGHLHRYHPESRQCQDWHSPVSSSLAFLACLYMRRINNTICEGENRVRGEGRRIVCSLKSNLASCALRNQFLQHVKCISLLISGIAKPMRIDSSVHNLLELIFW